ncbi:hypothetical protein [Radiobacillus deserti]|uniref:Uncharacterized protein n=1 Tax=Radiobacillus deserti TaxID=2594883 RepID=A0A516KEE9_9BACI|nr:hypothetical protein [Radiobacillus deserti]QDP39782.1 hypothetical protein FN924_06115 [Radiobacillus deserti]
MFFQKDNQKHRKSPHPNYRVPPHLRPYAPQISKSEKDQESFDLVDTAQTLMETYDQLSPYVKGISNRLLKKKKD